MRAARLMFACSLLVFAMSSVAAGAEWRQWRGDERNGVAAKSPALRTSLPTDGLKPLWVSESMAAGNDGGWGSPVIADGKAYVFVHSREKVGDGTLPPRKFPYLSEDKRGHLNAEQYAEYEVNRRAEDFERGKQFKYQEIVYAIDIASGKTLWKNERSSIYTRFLQSGTPAVVDGKLYILGAGRTARCLDATTGKDIWQTKIPGEFHDEFFMSSFVIVDNTAVVLAGYLVGLDIKSGEILWKGDESTTKGTHSSAVTWTTPSGKPWLIVNVAGSSTAAIEPRTGKEAWRVKSEANLSTPVIVGNKFITLGNSRRSGMRCFEMSETGAKELWVYNGLGDKGSSPLVIGDYVYAQGEKRLACVELATGKAAWMAQLDLTNPQYTSLVAADGKVIYAYDGLLCFAADPSEFKSLITAKFDKSGRMASEAYFREQLKIAAVEKEAGGTEKAARLMQDNVNSQGPLACSSPAIVDGRLYVRLKAGLACFDLTASGP
jgi:outer membrane protein assembly factor BamB